MDIMIPIYKDYFNVNLNTGIIPETWLNGFICPIYKRSGSPTSPENYRQIKLVSCLSKLFTSIISSMLNEFIDTFEIMNEINVKKIAFGNKEHITDWKMGVSVLLRLFISGNSVCNTAYALSVYMSRNSIFKYTTMGSMIPKEMKYNLHYGDVRGDILPPPYDTNTSCSVVK